MSGMLQPTHTCPIAVTEWQTLFANVNFRYYFEVHTPPHPPLPQATTLLLAALKLQNSIPGNIKKVKTV